MLYERNLLFIIGSVLHISVKKPIPIERHERSCSNVAKSDIKNSHNQTLKVVRVKLRKKSNKITSVEDYLVVNIFNNAKPNMIIPHLEKTNSKTKEPHSVFGKFHNGIVLSLNVFQAKEISNF